LESDSRARPINYSGDLDFKGINVPGGSGCLLRAYITFSMAPAPQTTFGGDGTNCLIPRTMGDYSVQNVLVGGTATARRDLAPLSDATCDGQRCPYEITGSQLITITPLEADFAFRGWWWGAPTPDKILFVEAKENATTHDRYIDAVPVSFNNYALPQGMPFRNVDFTWIPGDPNASPQTVSCYAGWIGICNRNAYSTGIMTSRTRVNGVEHKDSVTIYCSDSMAVFNSDSVRQGLMAVLDSSGAGVDSVNPLFRAERAFFILQDTTTPGSKPYVFILPKKPHADACGLGGRPQEFSDRPANTKVLAWGHDHPGLRYTIPCKDTLGNYINDEHGNIKVFALVPGVSDKDWNEAFRRNDPNYSDHVGPVNTFYMQSDGTLLILRPGQMRGAALNLTANHFKWQTTRCAWPRRRL
jgi:hypothetical protein